MWVVHKSGFVSRVLSVLVSGFVSRLGFRILLGVIWGRSKSRSGRGSGFEFYKSGFVSRALSGLVARVVSFGVRIWLGVLRSWTKSKSRPARGSEFVSRIGFGGFGLGLTRSASGSESGSGSGSFLNWTALCATSLGGSHCEALLAEDEGACSRRLNLG